MANEITINTQLLNGDISEMRNQLQAIRTDMVDMQTSFAALKAMWEGDASTAYALKFNRDIKKIEDMVKMYEKLIQGYEQAIKTYNTCEKEVGQIISSIQV